MKRIGPRKTAIVFTPFQLKAAKEGTLERIQLFISRTISVPAEVAQILPMHGYWEYRNVEGKKIGHSEPEKVIYPYGKKGDIVYCIEAFRQLLDKNALRTVQYLSTPEDMRYVEMDYAGNTTGVGAQVPEGLREQWPTAPQIEANKMRYEYSRFRYKITDLFISRLHNFAQYGDPKDYGIPTAEEFPAIWDENFRSDKWKRNHWVWNLKVETLQLPAYPVEKRLIQSANSC